jgi:DNA repair exonuclease SbcCD nuclease subunit
MLKKVAIVTDTHLGMRRANPVFLESQLRFFKTQFIPYLKENGINVIFILGDFFDNRVNIDSKILDAALELFNVDMKDFEVHMIVGNHDSYLESSVEIHSIKALGFFDNVKVYSKNESIKMFGRDVFMCPWITNKKAFEEELEALPKHDICFGHFEFANFMMFKDKECDHGVDANKFYDKFELTMSGHFHTRSMKEKDNSKIVYIGNPYHMTRSDIGDERGFCILDFDTLEYELINNDVSLKFVSFKYPEKIEVEQIKGNHVDLWVEYDENYDELVVQTYIEKLESYEPAFPIVVKTVNKIDVDNPDDLQITSIQDLITEYLANIDIPNKEKVERLILNLYEEAKSDV